MEKTKVANWITLLVVVLTAIKDFIPTIIGG